MKHPIPRAAHLLAEWMSERGWNAARLAAELGVYRARVSQWLSGARTPGRANANAIAALTRGRVPSDAWDEPRRPPFAAAA